MKQTTAQLLSLIIFLSLALTTVDAQDNKETEKSKEDQKEEIDQSAAEQQSGNDVPEEKFFQTKPLWSVGLQGGLSTGMGIGVRFHPKGRFAGQLVFGGFKTGEEWTYSFGFEFQFDFDSKGKSRFYGILGGGYYYEGEDGENSLKGPTRIGLGAGYEWDIATSLFLGGSVILTYHDDGSFYPLPQIGMFYYFE